MERTDLLRALPAVSRVLAARGLARLARQLGGGALTGLVREELARLRQQVASGRLDEQAAREAARIPAIAAAVARAATDLDLPRPQRVINATGIVVHTNLGRAVLSGRAAAAVAAAAAGYLDLEYELAGGKRGSRLAHLEPPLRLLFPGCGFTVVNNNAAALLLAVRALARGRQVLVSRGELVEIGGSFRVPEILRAAGGRLVEVGTTNRTRLADYEAAITPRTALILKVHTSNFKVVGFTEEASIAELAALARRANLPLLVDAGSGDLVDLARWAIPDEVPVARVLADGADLVCFSADKLLGGPQAGLVIGRAELIKRLRADPLARVCRIDRLQLAALHATLMAHVRGRAVEEIPTLRMIALPAAAIERRARRLASQVGRRARLVKLLRIVPGVSRIGGGSSPTGERPTRLIAVEDPRGQPDELARALRTGSPPIVARVGQERVLLDLRTVLPEEEPALAERLGELLKQRQTLKRK